jgi:hypothetical protein
MARMLRAREVPPISHPHNIYDTHRGTTLSLRHTHSVVDKPESTKKPDGGSSNDQSTLRDLSDSSLLLSKKKSILKLPELLPEHSPGDAIFEVEGQEYGALASTFSRDNSPNSSIRALVQIIKNKDFNQAYLLLNDIQDLNIPIPPSFAYQAPALAALRNGDLDSIKKVEQFTTWFSLIPPASSDKDGQFNETCDLIFQAKVPHLALIRSFAKIMASKGYGQLIIDIAIPLIIRYSPFEVGLHFLDEFNDANAKYWATHDPIFAAKNTKILENLVCGLAVRTLVFSNRVDDALSLLSDSEDTSFRLTSSTYNVLLRRLKKSKDVVHRQKISLVEKLRDQKSSDTVCPLTVLAEEAEMAANLKSAHPVDLTENLVTDLRYIKGSFLVEELVPHPFTIVNFMNAYVSTGRTRALELLYSRAARTGFRVLFTFIFAEMLFYNRLREYDLVIETFVDHFYLTGVPRERVLQRYNILSARRREFDPNTPGHPPPERCYKFDPHKTLSRGKLWPLSSHCNLVYHALVALAPIGPPIEALYQEFLQVVVCGKDTPTTPAINSVEPLVVDSRGRPSSGAFTPFFRRLMKAYGAARGTKILNDMVKCGIKPTIYHYTELASFYATSGDSKKAFLILVNLEGRLESAAHQKELGITKSSSLPAPDLVMYNSLMRGFIISKNLQAATDVAARLKRRHNYRKGEDSYLDEILREIEVMKEEQKQQVRFFSNL